jgi:hypothetical protein
LNWKKRKIGKALYKKKIVVVLRKDFSTRLDKRTALAGFRNSRTMEEIEIGIARSDLRF